jgi:hypothetical protein
LIIFHNLEKDDRLELAANKKKVHEKLLYDEEGFYSSTNPAIEDACFPVGLSPQDKEVKTPYVVKSIFANRPATIFFPYPKCCEQVRNNDQVLPMQGDFKLKYKITDSVCVYNCVIRALSEAGFTQTEGSSWNILWSAPLRPEVLKNFSKYQRCNHFSGTWQLGRKDNLWRNVCRYYV